MNVASLTLAIILLFACAAVAYVYRFRGVVRYTRFTQYLRKSWPVFAPFNCLLYMATLRSARHAVMEADYLEGVSALRRNWRRIRGEALALHESGAFEAASAPGSVGFHDLGFRTFHKRGWRKFYLKWYGEPHGSAVRLCPDTVKLLRRVPGIRAAMFSVLPAGAELTLHSDPLACSLRYHMGLQTPESDECYICVDGRRVSWRNGRDFVFDETYPHFARNDTDTPRLILMCDVERPMNLFGRSFNRLYSLLARAMAVPNTDEDPQGVVTWLFARVAPLRTLGGQLKRANRPVYTALKVLLNTALMALFLLPTYLVVAFFASVIE